MEYNILITCAGRRNYIINYFKEALKGRGKIIAVDNDEFASALVEADVSLCVPDVFDKNYIKCINPQTCSARLPDEAGCLPVICKKIP